MKIFIVKFQYVTKTVYIVCDFFRENDCKIGMIQEKFMEISTLDVFNSFNFLRY